nr:Toll-like receptor 6 [Arenicola marina]
MRTMFRYLLCVALVTLAAARAVRHNRGHAPHHGTHRSLHLTCTGKSFQDLPACGCTSQSTASGDDVIVATCSTVATGNDDHAVTLPVDVSDLTLELTSDAAQEDVEVTELHFSECSKLKTLRVISGCFTHVLHNTTLQGLNATEELSMTNLAIANLSDEVFASTPQLTSLSLRQNGIRWIDHATLNQCNRLKRLDLSDNKLQFIHREAFSVLKNLEELNLARNMLYLMTAGDLGAVLGPLMDLRVLDIHHNYPYDVGTNATDHPLTFSQENRFLQHLTQLECLEIDGVFGRNPVFSEEAGFKTLKNLRNLTLHGPMTNIRNDTFKVFRDVPIVSLSMITALEEIEPEGFSHLPVLQHLQLSSNIHIGSGINAGTMRPWYGLRHTSIISLNLTMVFNPTHDYIKLYKNFFNDLIRTNLTSLTLDHCSLENVSMGMMADAIPNLEYLSMENNVLVDVCKMKFTSLKALKTIYVGGQAPKNILICKRIWQNSPHYAYDEYRQIFVTPDRAKAARNDRITEETRIQISPAVELAHCNDSEEVDTHPEALALCRVYSEGEHYDVLEITLPPKVETLSVRDALHVRPYINYFSIRVNGTSFMQHLDFATNDLVDWQGAVVFMQPLHQGVNINLRNTHLRSVDLSDDLYAAVNVTSLDLGGNEIAGALLGRDMDWISNGTNLTTLDLSGNRITSLKSGTFTYMTRLESLVLAENAMRSVEFSLADLKHLKHLNLMSNLLSGFDGQTMDEISELLQSRSSNESIQIDLRSNPLICSCDTLGFMEWVARYQDGGIQFIGIEQYQCTYYGHLTSLLHLDRMIREMRLSCAKAAIIISVCVSLAASILAIVLAVCCRRHRWDIKYFFLNLSIWRKAHSEEKVSYKYDVFVGYCEDDVSWVKNVLAPALEEGDEEPKLKLCMHHRDFLPGELIEENILKNMKASRKTMLILSRGFARSGWCKFETYMTRALSFEQGRDLAVIVKREEVPYQELCTSLRTQLLRYTYLEWPSNPEKQPAFWKKLRQALTRADKLLPPVCMCGNESGRTWLSEPECNLTTKL